MAPVNPSQLKVEDRSAKLRSRSPLQNLDDRSAGGLVDDFNPRDDVASHGINALTTRSIFPERGNRFSGIATDANLRINLDFTKKGYAEIFRHVLAFAVAEHIDAAFAMRAVEIAHVLDHTKNLDIHLPEHFDGFADVSKRDDGRRGNHYRASDRNTLNKRELNVTRAGWQINDEVVESAPLRAAQKLLDHAVQHRAAPDKRFVTRVQQAHGNHFQA